METRSSPDGYDVSGQSEYVQFAKDLFVFSYLCSGINFTDMANLTPDNIVERRLLYTRQKTGKRINLPLCDEASVIIQKYMNQDETNKYIFPILHQNVHKTEMQKYNRRKKVKVPKFEKKYIKHILFLATAMMR